MELPAEPDTSPWCAGKLDVDGGSTNRKRSRCSSTSWRSPTSTSLSEEPASETVGPRSSSEASYRLGCRFFPFLYQRQEVAVLRCAFFPCALSNGLSQAGQVRSSASSGDMNGTWPVLWFRPMSKAGMRLMTVSLVNNLQYSATHLQQFQKNTWMRMESG